MGGRHGNIHGQSPGYFYSQFIVNIVMYAAKLYIYPPDQLPEDYPQVIFPQIDWQDHNTIASAVIDVNV